MLYNIYRYPILIGAGTREQVETNLMMARLLESQGVNPDIARQIHLASRRRDIQNRINRAEARIVQIYRTPGSQMFILKPPYDAPTQAGLTEIIRVLGDQNPPMAPPTGLTAVGPDNHPLISPVALMQAQRIITLRAQLAALN